MCQQNEIAQPVPTSLDSSKHSVISFPPRIVEATNPSQDNEFDKPDSNLDRSRHKPPDKDRRVAMRKSMLRVKKSLWEKKGKLVDLSYEEVVNEELANLVMLDSESQDALGNMVVEPLSSI